MLIILVVTDLVKILLRHFLIKHYECLLIKFRWGRKSWAFNINGRGGKLSGKATTIIATEIAQ